MLEALRRRGQPLELRTVMGIDRTRNRRCAEALRGRAQGQRRPTIGTLGVVMLALITPSLAGCGGAATSTVTVTSPFSARDGELFDDAADYLTDPSGLSGAWADGWAKDLDERTKTANVVAVVKVKTIVSDIDLQQRKGVRLVPELSRAIRGTLPPDTGLSVSEGRPGYTSVDHNRTQLMDGDYVLFLKWYRTDDKSVLAHWHLAPASEAVMTRIEKALGMGEKSSSHIVIHKD